jgi:hypothetical protein
MSRPVKGVHNKHHFDSDVAQTILQIKAKKMSADKRLQLSHLRVDAMKMDYCESGLFQFKSV